MSSLDSPLIHSDLRAFFNSLLVNAFENQKLTLSPKASNYVTDLLVSFQTAEKLFQQEGVRIPVLADMVSEALEADFHRRVSILRQMGDTSLMVSGFYPEAISRRAVDLSYYRKMGVIAYQQLGSLTVEVNVFDELSAAFERLIYCLNEISEEIHGQNYSLSKLLEFYSSTGSERALEQLKRQGVIPIRAKKSTGED